MRSLNKILGISNIFLLYIPALGHKNIYNKIHPPNHFQFTVKYCQPHVCTLCSRSPEPAPIPAWPKFYTHLTTSPFPPPPTHGNHHSTLFPWAELTAHISASCKCNHEYLSSYDYLISLSIGCWSFIHVVAYWQGFFPFFKAEYSANVWIYSVFFIHSPSTGIHVALCA